MYFSINWDNIKIPKASPRVENSWPMWKTWMCSKPWRNIFPYCYSVYMLFMRIWCLISVKDFTIHFLKRAVLTTFYELFFPFSAWCFLIYILCLGYMLFCSVFIMFYGLKPLSTPSCFWDLLLVVNREACAGDWTQASHMQSMNSAHWVIFLGPLLWWNRL